MDAFSRYHPAVNLALFGTVFLCLCLCAHPVLLTVALLSGGAYYGVLKGADGLGKSLKTAVPLMLFAALLNPLISHAGATVLLYLPWKAPLTLESIYFGISAGLTVGAFLLWFGCFSAVFTTDKLLCVFGRFAPALSLVLSMTLRFVPRFRHRFARVWQARKAEKSLPGRLKSAVACFSAVMTWSLENAIDTADSMKARGYGLKKRKAYSRFPWTGYDGLSLCLILLCDFFLLSGFADGHIAWQYYPTIKAGTGGLLTAAMECAYGGVCFAPVILEGMERWQWKRFK